MFNTYRKVLVIAGLVFCLFSHAFAIDYSDFPPNLQQILNQRIAELTSNGGICIAGRVTMSDGAYISGGEDVLVNLYHGIDEPLWVYEDGWFIMGRTLSSYYAGPGKGFVLRAFGYDPIDASITILNGEMTYLEFEMQKTPTENLASVTGTVVNDCDQPFDGAHVSHTFPFADHGYRGDIGYTYPHMEMTTGVNGQYLFEGLSVAEHSLTASASGYAYHHVRFTPPAGGTAIENLKLYKNRSIIIDYVYQADGSRSFTSGNLQTGTIEWVNGNEGVDFSDGRVEGYEPQSLRDIEMRQDQDMLKFQIFYCNGQNGFYDGGAVVFESITEAAQTGYSTMEKPCVIGHVYIVRTYENKYAKFVVVSSSGSEPCHPQGDFNLDWVVDAQDLVEFTNQWLENCYYPYSSNWCQGTDLNKNGFVNFVDFAIFAKNWLWTKIPAE